MQYRNPISADVALCHLLGAAMRSADGVMRLRKWSFARILAAAPELVTYRLDYGSGCHFPTFDCGTGALRIVLSEEIGRATEAA